MSTTPGSMPASPPERIVARLRPHARVLALPSLVFVATCGGLGYFAGAFEEVWQVTLLYSAAAMIVVLLFLLPLAFWLSTRYTLTTRRIILRRGVFVRVRQELLHSRGYDVSVRRNWLQSAFRSGDVRINSGQDNPVVLHDVPNADAVQSALHDLMEHSQNVVAVRRQHDESVVADQTAVWGSR